MASNVFGTPITYSTLKRMPEYEQSTAITRADLASVALINKNMEGKDLLVRKYVEEVGKKSGSELATLCVIYNATGGTIRYVDSRHWYSGRLAEGGPYPVLIENGQWGGFVHVKAPNAGSHGGFVYRGKNHTGDACDWMVCWENPKDRANYDNLAYTEVREKDHFKDAWDAAWDNMEKEKARVKIDTWKGCESFTSTGSGYYPIFEAIFALEEDA